MTYGFFPGCSFKNAAGYAQSVTALTRKLGLTFTEIQDWNCCGATVFHGSDDIKAASLAARIFALAEKDKFKEIITGCNACYSTLRKAGEKINAKPDYQEIINDSLKDETLHLKRVLPVRHLLQVLTADLPKDVWSANVHQAVQPIAVAGYYGCQLTRPWGDIDDPEQPGMLERLIESLGFLPVEHSAKTLCCGASLSIPYGDDCLPLVERIVRGARSNGARMIATICPLCQFNLDQAQLRMPKTDRLPVLFFTQMAGLALGLSPESLGLDRLLVPAKPLLKDMK